MSEPRRTDPISLPENATFAIMMVLAAYLSRENPDFRYPEILWAFLGFFAFNLAYFSRLRETLPQDRAAAVAVGVNILLILAIVQLSGGQESYLWVMYLLPLFSAALSLERKGALAAAGAVFVALIVSYRGAAADRAWVELSEMCVKALTLTMAAAAIARVATQERQTRRLLDEKERERAEERLETQERFRHVDRLATMGTMMAGITHELKGPLSTILAAARLLEEEDLPGPRPKDLVARILKATDRSQETIKNMLGFARKDSTAKAPTDVAALLRRCVGLKRHDWIGGAISIEESYAADLPSILASQAELEQVVFNLLQNAEQALRSTANKGGALVVRAEPVGEKIRISIADDGPGIPPESLERIWEPFFTTKQVGQGTGLGLAICREIVKAHAGTLKVESKPGRTVFTVEIPKSA